MVEKSMVKDGKKFMWDGREYVDRPSAEEQLENYRTSDFEAQLVEEGGRFYLFTRRVVTEIMVEGAPA